ncbi:MAG: PDZ domain-containing protein [Clostridia bacterium]|nr:PDZ domain-containing protein [Clostridia bacterium]
MKRKISISTAITLILLTAALTVSLTMLLAMRLFNSQLQLVSQRQAMYTHINDVDKKVRKYYPDLDEETLRQGITQGYIYGLNDPYAVYYNPTRWAAEKVRIAGKNSNVGVALSLDSEARIVVSRVQSDSAAGKAGVLVGDVVTAVDGEPIEGKSLSELQTLVTTAEQVLLTVQRGEESHAYDLKAFEYTVRTVQDTMLGTVGYIKITAFYENTPDQFRAVISAMLEHGVTGLVFDLRNNAGGSSEAVQEILNYIMPLGSYGTLTDVSGNTVKLNTANSNQLSVSSVTLVNSGTAGEAEFFAGVLQDASLTTVVGQTSAGKAKYQDYFILDTDSSAVKLTVGEYGLLKSGSWQDKGIIPTVTVELPAEQAAVYQLLSPEEDAQVQAAVEQIATSELPTPDNTTTTTTTTTEESQTDTSTETTADESEE